MTTYAQVMCGIYRDGGTGYGGPAADETFYDPAKVGSVMDL